MINREREATPETPSWNVVIVTTGIARRWFQDGDIRAQDTLVVDEIHQTSAELELCLALGKRAGCRFIWLSATVDPTFYARYLESTAVIESSVFDKSKAADVQVVRAKPQQFLDDRFLQRVAKEKRGVGVFLPTRAAVEEAATGVGARFPRITSQFYHGGEPIRVIRPFLDGTIEKPYLLAMTAAGQSALNVRGLDTVVIDDTRFANVVDRGRNVLTRVHLGANEILQMAGRVHGRVAGGRVFILSDRDIAFHALRPTEPEFQLAGDSERVALTCAALGVRADEMELPVPLDVTSYRKAVALLESRGIVQDGALTTYGKSVEAMPVDRPWAELLVHCDDELLPYVAVMAGIESLHRMTREDRDLGGLMVRGSDHLTAYNVYAEAFTKCGYVGEVYGLPRHLFDESIERWADRRGVLVKSMEDAALAMASVYRAVRLPLPTAMPKVTEGFERKFVDLLARLQPFGLVIDEETATGDDVRVSKTSVAGSWGAIAGEVRYFADKMGVPRAAVEGTNIPMAMIRRYAREHEPELVFDPSSSRAPLVLRRRVTYHGFELEREVEPIDDIPPELVEKARHLLAEGLARGDARHAAAKNDRLAIEEIRESWRRSGGKTPRLTMDDLAAIYEKQLAEENVSSFSDFRRARIGIDAESIVPRRVREEYMALPDFAEIRGREIPIRYDVEESPEGMRGIARLTLPEKIARTLSDAEIPPIDRPLRFVVTRGQRGAARADTLDALREELDRPFTEKELSDLDRSSDRRREERKQQRQERHARQAARELRRERAPSGDERRRGPRPAFAGPPRGKKRRPKRGR